MNIEAFGIRPAVLSGCFVKPESISRRRSTGLKQSHQVHLLLSNRRRLWRLTDNGGSYSRALQTSCEPRSIPPATPLGFPDAVRTSELDLHGLNSLGAKQIAKGYQPNNKYSCPDEKRWRQDSYSTAGGIFSLPR